MSIITEVSMDVSMRLLQRALQGTVYPTNTGEMVEVAEFNFAPDFVIDMITDLGDSQYFSFLDVAQEITYRRKDSGDETNNDDDEDEELYSSEFDFLDQRKEYF